MLPDVASQPVTTWRSGDLTLHQSYDAGRRPVALTVDEGSGSRLVTLTIYGDALSDTPAADFAQGRPLHVYDTAGRVTLAYDFRGRTVEQTRQVFEDIETEADWTGPSRGRSMMVIPLAWAGARGRGEYLCLHPRLTSGVWSVNSHCLAPTWHCLAPTWHLLLAPTHYSPTPTTLILFFHIPQFGVYSELMRYETRRDLTANLPPLFVWMAWGTACAGRLDGHGGRLSSDVEDTGPCVEDTGTFGTVEVTVTVDNAALLDASRSAVDSSLSVYARQCEGDAERSRNICYVSFNSWVDAHLDLPTEIEAPLGWTQVGAEGADRHSSDDGESRWGYECYGRHLVCMRRTNNADVEIELACESFLYEA